MSRKKKCMGSMAVAMVAAMMATQIPVFAEEDVTEELNQILEAQFSAETESALDEYLGLKALQEAFAANGMQVQVQAGLTEESGALLEGTVPEGAYLNLGFAQDPNAKQWQLSLGAGLEDESLLDVSLYGDEAMLALSLPQFCSSALGVRAGSFLEQYDSSALKDFLGIGDLGIDDFNMSFYPEDTGAAAEDGSLETELSENLQQELDDFLASGFSMTKTDTEDGVNYVAVVDTDEALELYGAFIEDYLDTLDEMGILDLYMTGLSSTYSTEDMDLEEVIEASLEEMSAMMGEEGIITFYVQNDLLQCVTYQIDIYDEDDYADTDDMSEDVDAEEASELTGNNLMAEGDDIAAPEETEGADAAAEEAEESSAVTDEPGGTLSISFILNDPAQPDDAFTLYIEAKEYGAEENAGTITISKQTEQADTLTETTIDVIVAEFGEVQYDETVYRLSFDSATGDMDMTAGITDPDSGEYVGLKLESVFHDIAQGSSFGWTIEELSIVAEDESIGLTGEVSVQADPGTIAETDAAMIFEADEDTLNNLIMEIYMNAMTWAEEAQSTWNGALGIEPETEDYGYDYDSDGDYWYGDDSDDDYWYGDDSDDDYWYGDDSDDDYWYGDDSDDDYWYGDEVQTEEVIALDTASA
ncbi:MAG: MSCRAMM family adhesin SdrC [Clostridiales bacterium]|nr:MSCRAMM family adhesin SdrC [Clostridiales bacterium]